MCAHLKKKSCLATNGDPKEYIPVINTSTCKNNQTKYEYVFQAIHSLAPAIRMYARYSSSTASRSRTICIYPTTPNVFATLWSCSPGGTRLAVACATMKTIRQVLVGILLSVRILAVSARNAVGHKLALSSEPYAPASDIFAMTSCTTFRFKTSCCCSSCYNSCDGDGNY